jgi:hypothetical protein
MAGMVKKHAQARKEFFQGLDEAIAAAREIGDMYGDNPYGDRWRERAQRLERFQETVAASWWQ